MRMHIQKHIYLYTYTYTVCIHKHKHNMNRNVSVRAPFCHGDPLTVHAEQRAQLAQTGREGIAVADLVALPVATAQLFVKGSVQVAVWRL